jgi:hypothetical protein
MLLVRHLRQSKVHLENSNYGPAIMINSFRFFVRFGAPLAVVVFASSYECRAASPDTPFFGQLAQTTPASAPTSADTNSNQKLRDAAEPFEKLTEISFTAALPKIDQTISEAEAAARATRGLLLHDAANQLDAQISAMKTARQKQDRAGLALSSIEGYRVLVSAVTDKAKVPTEVSLLDYAGFRYDADLKANPVRWSDMAQAVSFARKNWVTLSPRVKSSPLTMNFEKAITDMDKAVLKRSKQLAASSVKTELDLVDQLEKFFSAQ